MINPNLQKLLDVMRSKRNTNTVGVYGHFKVGEEFCAVGFILNQYKLKTRKGKWLTVYNRSDGKPVQVLMPENTEKDAFCFFGLPIEYRNDITAANDRERLTLGQIANLIEQLAIKEA